MGRGNSRDHEHIQVNVSSTNNNDLKPEIEKMILHANRAYYALNPILKIHADHRAEKIKIYKSLIGPVTT